MNMKKITVTGVCLIVACILSGCSQSSSLAKPTQEQLAFHDLELGVFVHYSIDTYAERGSRPGQTPASAFNPTDLDVEQWVLAAKDMGATFMVLTARHEQGFCLWPTKTTDYSIRYAPYKSGQGDIVREFVDACRKHGLKPGLYTAPWIDSHWEDEQGIKVKDSGDINKLNDQSLYEKALKKEKEQIKELMSDYGDLVFIWDDHFGRSDALDEIRHGGKLRELYATLSQYAHELQPGCLLLGRDVEHVGTENGRACYPLWNSLNTIDGTIYSVSDTYRWNHDNTGRPEGKYYRPQIACTTVAFTTGGWMWSNPRIPQPLERIMKTYDETVGRGAVLIVNFAPDRRGLVEDEVVAAAKTFGDEVKRRFSNPVAVSTAKEPEQIIKFDNPETFNHVVTMEDLKDGQKVGGYTIEAEINGQWETIVTGLTIGHKRIDRFPAITATAIRFKVTETVAQPVIMRSLAVYNVYEDSITM